MVWLSHKKYTELYVSEQFAAFCSKMRRESRRMVYVALGATALMAAIQSALLLSVSPV